MNSATDGNIINKDYYIFYFNKFLTSIGNGFQNDVLTKEKLFANVLKYGGSITMGKGILLSICNTINPDPTVKTAAQLATHTSHLINRTGSKMNMAYGTPSNLGTKTGGPFTMGHRPCFI